MSYCRWSSDNFMSDVYVYNTGEQIEICIAGSRYESDEPFPVPASDDPYFIREYHRVTAWIEAARQVPINLPHAGGLFAEPAELAAANAKIAAVRALPERYVGYNPNDYVKEQGYNAALAAARKAVE